MGQSEQKSRKSAPQAQIDDEKTVTPEHDEMHSKAPSSVFYAQLDFARAKATRDVIAPDISLARARSALV